MEHGNFTVIKALAMVPIMTGVAGAVDFVTSTNRVGKLKAVTFAMPSLAARRRMPAASMRWCVDGRAIPLSGHFTLQHELAGTHISGS